MVSSAINTAIYVTVEFAGSVSGNIVALTGSPGSLGESRSERI
jgi:hypothetical protein